MGLDSPTHRGVCPCWQRGSQVRHFDFLYWVTQNHRWEPPLVLFSLLVRLGSVGPRWCRLLCLLPTHHQEMEDFSDDLPWRWTSSGFCQFTGCRSRLGHVHSSHLEYCQRHIVRCPYSCWLRGSRWLWQVFRCPRCARSHCQQYPRNVLCIPRVPDHGSPPSTTATLVLLVRRGSDLYRLCTGWPEQLVRYF